MTIFLVLAIVTVILFVWSNKLAVDAENGKPYGGLFGTRIWRQ